MNREIEKSAKKVGHLHCVWKKHKLVSVTINDTSILKIIKIGDLEMIKSMVESDKNLLDYILSTKLKLAEEFGQKDIVLYLLDIKAKKIAVIYII